MLFQKRVTVQENDENSPTCEGFTHIHL